MNQVDSVKINLLLLICNHLLKFIKYQKKLKIIKNYLLKIKVLLYLLMNIIIIYKNHNNSNNNNKIYNNSNKEIIMIMRLLRLRFHQF